MSRGRIPDVDTLTAKISKMERAVSRAEVYAKKLPALKARLAEITSPDFESKRTVSNVEKAQSLLSKLDPRARAELLAKLV